ncbi:hypothetical protein ACFL08_05055 [Patescibacteria group bacterium]
MTLGDMLIERICGGYKLNGELSNCKECELIGVENNLLVLVGTDDFEDFRVWCQVFGALEAEEVEVVFSSLRNELNSHHVIFVFNSIKYAVFINKEKDKPRVFDITLGSKKLPAEFLTIAR